MKSLVPLEVIEKKILLIGGQKVMLDSDLAELYGVETKALVRRHKEIARDSLMTSWYS
jgi:ORF6N domain